MLTTSGMMEAREDLSEAISEAVFEWVISKTVMCWQWEGMSQRSLFCFVSNHSSSSDFLAHVCF